MEINSCFCHMSAGLLLLLLCTFVCLWRSELRDHPSFQWTYFLRQIALNLRQMQRYFNLRWPLTRGTARHLPPKVYNWCRYVLHSCPDFSNSWRNTMLILILCPPCNKDKEPSVICSRKEWPRADKEMRNEASHISCQSCDNSCPWEEHQNCKRADKFWHYMARSWCWWIPNVVLLLHVHFCFCVVGS
jgi:hypothetical protein